MTHDSLLNNFSIRWVRRAVENELISVTIDGDLDYTVHNFLKLRWNCVFNSPEEEISQTYKDKTYITIALYFHKFGLYYQPIMEQAVRALKSLLGDENDFMPKHMYKKAEFAIQLLKTKPNHTVKKNSATVHVYKRSLTQFRKGDVFSIKLENEKFAVAIVKNIEGFNEYPTVELFKEQFDKKPLMDDLTEKTIGEAQWSVTNLINIPDLANQMQLIGNMDVTYDFKPHSLVKLHKFLEMITNYTSN